MVRATAVTQKFDAVFIAQASVYQHVHEVASTNVLLVLTVHSNTVFHSLNESVFERIE